MKSINMVNRDGESERDVRNIWKTRKTKKYLTWIKSNDFALGSITKDCICATCESSRISKSENATRKELSSLLFISSVEL